MSSSTESKESSRKRKHSESRSRSTERDSKSRKSKKSKKSRRSRSRSASGSDSEDDKDRSSKRRKTDAAAKSKPVESKKDEVSSEKPETVASKNDVKSTVAVEVAAPEGAAGAAGAAASTASTATATAATATTTTSDSASGKLDFKALAASRAPPKELKATVEETKQMARMQAVLDKEAEEFKNPIGQELAQHCRNYFDKFHPIPIGKDVRPDIGYEIFISKKGGRNGEPTMSSKHQGTGDNFQAKDGVIGGAIIDYPPLVVEQTLWAPWGNFVSEACRKHLASFKNRPFLAQQSFAVSTVSWHKDDNYGGLSKNGIKLALFLERCGSMFRSMSVSSKDFIAWVKTKKEGEELTDDMAKMILYGYYKTSTTDKNSTSAEEAISFFSEDGYVQEDKKAETTTQKKGVAQLTATLKEMVEKYRARDLNMTEVCKSSKRLIWSMARLFKEDYGGKLTGVSGGLVLESGRKPVPQQYIGYSLYEDAWKAGFIPNHIKMVTGKDGTQEIPWTHQHLMMRQGAVASQSVKMRCFTTEKGFHIGGEPILVRIIHPPNMVMNVAPAPAPLTFASDDADVMLQIQTVPDTTVALFQTSNIKENNTLLSHDEMMENFKRLQARINKTKSITDGVETQGAGSGAGSSSKRSGGGSSSSSSGGRRDRSRERRSRDDDDEDMVSGGRED